MIGEVGRSRHENYYVLGSKMSIKQQNRLTNQPETGAIASTILSRVVGVLGSVAEAGLVESQPIEMTNCRRSIFDHVGGVGGVGEAERQQQQPPCQQARLLGCYVDAGQGGGPKSRPLLRYGHRFGRR